jgi:RimJ/RimL family protein N-acetyltransferase
VILRALESRRITLIAATAELVEADLSGRGKLSALLDAVVPENWPPDLYERRAMEFALHSLQDSDGQEGWSFWYLLTRGAEQREVIGICGFKGRPDESGSVEIGYSLLNQFRVNGYATCAETLPYLRQSIRVMEKNGFTFTGPGSEHGVVRYAVQRPDQR